MEDSSMSILKGEFSMIMTVTFPTTLRPEVLSARLEAIQRDFGLLISHRIRDGVEAPTESGDDGESYILSIYGADRPGLLFGVSDLLARHGINITDLRTTTLERGGTAVYVMFLEVDLPPGTDWDAVDAELKTRCSDLSVEVTVQPLDRTLL